RGAPEPRRDEDRPDREARQHRLHSRAAEDPEREDHAPPAPRCRGEPAARRHDHAGRPGGRGRTAGPGRERAERGIAALPTPEAERVVLRPFTLADAPDVQRLCSDRAIAEGTLNIPHPYPDGAAEAWIGTQDEKFATGNGLSLAIERREDGALV